MQGAFESNSYYYFHKILAIPNYMIGKRTLGFIENYMLYYKNAVKDKDSGGDILPKAVVFLSFI